MMCFLPTTSTRTYYMILVTVVTAGTAPADNANAITALYVGVFL